MIDNPCRPFLGYNIQNRKMSPSTIIPLAQNELLNTHYNSLVWNTAYYCKIQMSNGRVERKLWGSNGLHVQTPTKCLVKREGGWAQVSCLVGGPVRQWALTAWFRHYRKKTEPSNIERGCDYDSDRRGVLFLHAARVRWEGIRAKKCRAL